MLGRGAFGKVYLTYHKNFPDLQVAIKVLDKQKLIDHIEIIKEEVAILSKLDHINIVKYYETYEDDD